MPRPASGLAGGVEGLLRGAGREPGAQDGTLVLKQRAHGATTAYRDWLPAQIVLAAARGRASARNAADPRVSMDTVRKVARPVRRPRPGRP